MNTLHVRNVPDDIYESLRERAEERGSSISKETIRLLARALRSDRRGIGELLDEVAATRPRARAGTASAADLVREDRDAH